MQQRGMHHCWVHCAALVEILAIEYCDIAACVTPIDQSAWRITAEQAIKRAYPLEIELSDINLHLNLFKVQESGESSEIIFL